MSRKEFAKKALEIEAVGVRERLKTNISLLPTSSIQETSLRLPDIAQGISRLQQLNEKKIINQNPFVGIDDTQLSFLQTTATTTSETHKNKLDNHALSQPEREKLNKERNDFTLIAQAVENELGRRKGKQQEDITLQETTIMPSIIKPKKESQPAKLSEEQLEKERKIEEGRRGYLEKTRLVEDLFGFDENGNPRSWIQSNFQRKPEDPKQQ